MTVITHNNYKITSQTLQMNLKRLQKAAQKLQIKNKNVQIPAPACFVETFRISSSCNRNSVSSSIVLYYM